MKVRCSLNDGDTALYWWEGRMYSRMPAEKDRHLFNVQGMNIRHCETLKDPLRGLGFVARSRELMFYLDPETNEVLRTWTNPLDRRGSGSGAGGQRSARQLPRELGPR